jgi:II/X family phage/plasmid replication protein
MALDTLKLRSPKLSAAVADVIERQLVLRMAVDQVTDNVLYEILSGTLLGSWDAHISVQVLREEWKAHGRSVIKVPCAPYLVVESSVHKAMLGHNLHGGPCDVQAAAAWFVSHIAGRLGVELPSASLWHVRRVDWAEVFDLGYAETQLYIHGLSGARFPRRDTGKIGRFGNNSLHVPGDTTTVKVYHKGPEFAAHDGKRLKLILPGAELESLSKWADRLLRVEVSVRAPKLDGDFGHAPTVGEVSTEYLTKVHDQEVARLLKEGNSDMQTVRKNRDVRDRLFEVYKARLAGVLFGTWLQLAALGEEATRGNMKRPTYYRQLKQLQEAGIAWHGGDVRVIEVASILPADFSPVRRDPRRLSGEDPKVIELLAPFRKVA